ncbi:MAG: hypothetical protein AAFQ37_06880 [Bacteroidota bacterium]
MAQTVCEKLNLLCQPLIFCICGCSQTFSGKVIELNFLDQPTVLEDQYEKIRVSGWIRAEFETDLEFVSYMNERNYRHAGILQPCNQKIDMGSWSHLYRIPDHQKNRYYFIIPYKDNIKGGYPIQFDFSKTSWANRDLCFFVVALEANPFHSVISKEIRFNLTKDVIEKIKKYDEESGEVSVVEVLSSKPATLYTRPDILITHE